MTLTGTRFGDIEYSELDTITFDEGLIGFPFANRYIVLNQKEGSPFRWLQCLTEPALAFLVTDPANYLTDYKPEISDVAARAISIEENTPRILLTTVNIPKGRPQDMTLNLAGPIVINAAERKGKQIVLEDGAYTTRYRVFHKADRVSDDAAA